MLAMLMVLSYFTQAQNPTDSLPGDPGALSVYTVQNMSFGAFSAGASGGSVILSNSGTRTTTGTVLGLNTISHFVAMYEVDAPYGSIISILNGPNATLTGSNGGSMTLTIGNSLPASPFMVMVNQPARTEIKIGGTLNVGSAATSPPGTYSGNFYITFNYE